MTRTQNYVKAASEAVVKAGKAIRKLPRVFKVKKGEGHRSGVTEGDLRSQKIILSHLSKRFPHARFLCEEDTSHPRAFNKKNPLGILEAELVFVIDSTDSTASYAFMLDGWCVAIGIMEYGEITGGAVYAPATNGGLLIVSEKGKGVTTTEWDGRIVRRVAKCKKTLPKESIMLFGADAPLFRNVANLLPEIYANFRLGRSGSSGILTLARAGAGYAQLIFQTPQKPWDWIPAYLTVLETGRKIQFYRLVKGRLVLVSKYDFKAMCTSMETAEGRLGFVAGEPALVKKFLRRLPRTGWERFVPDTVGGKW